MADNYQLRIYVEENNFDEIKNYLDIYYPPQSTLDDALIHAAKNGYIPLIDLLISYGAEFNYVTQLPLKIAIDNNRIDTIRFLLEKGADPTMPNCEIIKYTIKKNYIDIDIVKIFMEYLPNAVEIINKKELLIEAILAKNLECVKLFIELGASINDVVYLAICQNDIGITKYLINCGAHISSTMFYKIVLRNDIKTLLSKEMLVLLGEFGIDVNLCLNEE